MDEVTTFCHLWILEFSNRPSIYLTAVSYTHLTLPTKA